MALTWCNGEKVYINEVVYNSVFPKYKGINGQIFAKQNDTFIVKTSDSYILLIDDEFKCKLKVRDRDRLTS